MTRTRGPGGRNASEGRPGTVLETEEDVRQALLANAKVPPPTSSTLILPTIPPSADARPLARPYRPTARPPIPILTGFDDGKTEGEEIRIRGPRFSIGRTEGDLRLPLDGRMSSSHVEITHQVVGGVDRWVVTDLWSMHGMFVRVSKTVLADGAEILVGNRRYRFEAHGPDPAETVDPFVSPSNAGETQGLGDGPGPFRPPSMTELIGNRILLVKGEYWIGSGSRSDGPVARGSRDDQWWSSRPRIARRASLGGFRRAKDDREVTPSGGPRAGASVARPRPTLNERSSPPNFRESPARPIPRSPVRSRGGPRNPWLLMFRIRSGSDGSVELHSGLEIFHRRLGVTYG